MSQSDSPPPGPDLALGVPLFDVPSTGVFAGHVDGEAVLLARLDDGIFAVGGACTHYGAPLAEGLISSMPVAMATMDSVALRYGPSPKAFLLIALAGSFFVDLANAFIVKAFLTLSWFH